MIGVVALAVAAIGAVPSSAQAPTPTVSVQPASVPVHGTVTITGSCPSFGPEGFAHLTLHWLDGTGYRESAGLPLLEDGDFVIDLPLARGQTGNYGVRLDCDGPTYDPVEADPGFLVNDEPALPRAPVPTVSVPPEVASGDEVPVTATCPQTTPPADRVLFRQTLRRNPGAEQVAHEYAPVDASGAVSADVAPLRPDNPYDHALSMHCMAGDRFLGRSVGVLYRVAPVAATSTSTSTTDVPVAATVPPGAAPGAVPVAGTPSFTG